MNDLELLVRGALAGFAISAPVGPVNILVVSRTIAKGWVPGVVSGMGAAAADTIYGSIAGFSISLVIAFLVREIFWIRLFGGILLMFLGVLYYFKEPHLPDREEESGAETSDFGSACLLNLANPTVVLSFLGVLAILKMTGYRAWWQTLILVGGIFAGAMVWWIALVAVARYFRDRVDDRAMLWMNRTAGLAIGGFGVVTLFLSRRPAP